MRDPGVRSRLTRRLLSLCLLAWPVRERRLHGDAALQTARALVDDAGHRSGWRWLRELAGEAVGLLGAGVRMRRTAGGEASDTAAAGVGLVGDLRYAVRALRRSPGFTAVAALSLSLGIGANAAVYSLVDGLLLTPPPYQAPDRLVAIWNRLPDGAERIPVAAPDVAVIGERIPELAAVGFTIRGVDGGVAAPDGGAALPIRMAAVTPGFFETLGVEAVRGRVFTSADGPEAPGDAPPSVLLSHRSWLEDFGGDPTLIGRDIRVNDRPATVVGVLPPDFRLALSPDAGVSVDVDLWTPLRVSLDAFHRTDDRLLDQDSDNSGAVIGRLAPGATLERLQARLDGVADELRTEVPFYARTELGFVARPLQADATAHARPLLLTLLAAVGGVLLVACLNLAILVLIRGIGRRRELAVRAALGAGRGRLARQLAVEGSVVVGAGLLGGALAAGSGLTLLNRTLPAGLRPSTALTVHLPALLLSTGIAALVVLGFGVAPVLAGALRPGTRSGSSSGLGAHLSSRGSGVGRGRGRQALIVAEIALSVALIFGAGVLLQTVRSLNRVDPGFEAAGALSFQLSLRVPESYRGPGDRARFVDRLTGAIRSLPGVESAGVVGVLPLTGDRWVQPYGLPGEPSELWQRNRADFRVVSSGYFDAMGTRVLEGRAFNPTEDLEEGERVVVVDRTLARRIAPEGSALGASIGIPLDGAPVQARVVGVVETVRHERLDAEGRETVYVPYRQEASRDLAFVVRATGEPSGLASLIRAQVSRIDPRIPLHDVATMDDRIGRAVAPRRLGLRLLAGFALIGLGCAAVGLYGVLAFEVRRRTRDLGIRMAVGARRSQVLGGVLAVGLRLGAVGLVVGVLGTAWAWTRLEPLTVGVEGADPVLWTGVIGVVGAVVALASALPAWRASRLDPLEAVRTD